MGRSPPVRQTTYQSYLSTGLATPVSFAVGLRFQQRIATSYFTSRPVQQPEASMAICQTAEMTCIAPSAYCSSPAPPCHRNLVNGPIDHSFELKNPITDRDVNLIHPDLTGTPLLHGGSIIFRPSWSVMSQSSETLWQSSRRLVFRNAGWVAYRDLGMAM